jgi:hypothetical protein
VVVASLLAVGFLTRAGTTLLLAAWWRPRDLPDLAERPRLFCQRSVPDEAQRWLESY